MNLKIFILILSCLSWMNHCQGSIANLSVEAKISNAVPETSSLISPTLANDDLPSTQDLTETISPTASSNILSICFESGFSTNSQTSCPSKTISSQASGTESYILQQTIVAKTSVTNNLVLTSSKSDFKSPKTEVNTLSSVVKNDVVTTESTTINNASSEKSKASVFATVFGIFGGLLVLGIAGMVAKSFYTKSKNKVKKIKKGDIGKA